MDEVLELVRAVNPEVKVASVINQAPSLPSQVQRILDAKAACSSFGISPINAIVYNRNVYDDADESGSSVIEMDSDHKASAEIEAVAKEFLEV